MKNLHLLLLFSLATLVQAQNKKTVAIAQWSSSWDNRNYAKDLTELIQTEIFKTKKFNLVDRTSFDVLYTESNLQKGEDFIEGQVVAQGKKEGAEYIITGRLNQTSAQAVYEQTFKNNKRRRGRLAGYIGKVSFTIKIIDVVTGRLRATTNISAQSGSRVAVGMIGKGKNNDKWIQAVGAASPTKRDAIQKAIQNSLKDVSKFTRENFPSLYKVLKVSGSKKDRATEVVIIAGSSASVRRKQKLNVVELIEVEHEGQILERKEIIGELRVISVDDANFSTCQVLRGHREIKQKLDAKKILYVISN